MKREIYPLMILKNVKILNKFFSSVFTQENKTNVPDFNHNIEDLPNVENGIISINDMEKAISKNCFITIKVSIIIIIIIIIKTNIPKHQFD